MLLEKPAALRQRDRMRPDLANLVDARPWHSDQIVANAQQRFTFNGNIPIEQQIIVLGHRTRERILYRYHRPIDRPLNDRTKDIRGDRTGNDRGASLRSKCNRHAQSGLMTE
jgi:hypothetical protein